MIHVVIGSDRHFRKSDFKKIWYLTPKRESTVIIEWAERHFPLDALGDSTIPGVFALPNSPITSRYSSAANEERRRQAKIYIDVVR